LRDRISKSINFEIQSKLLLFRKADIICACYSKIGDFAKIIDELATLLKTKEGSSEADTTRKIFAMYSFEFLSEFHLSQDQITGNASTFLKLFGEILKNDNVILKAAALKTTVVFLATINDIDTILRQKSVMKDILDVVIEVL
jgi:hypothetical protein